MIYITNYNRTNTDFTVGKNEFEILKLLRNGSKTVQEIKDFLYEKRLMIRFSRNIVQPSFLQSTFKSLISKGLILAKLHKNILNDYSMKLIVENNEKIELNKDVSNDFFQIIQKYFDKNKKE